ncbi:hypothetical protein ACFX2G_019025 [Malus domestica]
MNVAYKKPRLVASINKSLAINSTILMSSDRDLEDVHSPHGDALVIKVQILNALDDRILVDNGFRVSVLFKDAAKKMGILDNINKGRTTLHNFNGATVQSFGTIKLAVQRKRNCETEHSKIIEAEIDKLKDAQFIIEVHHPYWLTNVVLTQKKNGNVRKIPKVHGDPTRNRSQPRSDQGYHRNEVTQNHKGNTKFNRMNGNPLQIPFKIHR